MKVLAYVLFVAALSVPVGAQQRGGMLDVGTAQLRYAVMGSGPALVFINGWALNYSVWDDQAVAFAPRYQVVRYDLRGFGKSTGHSDETGDADDLRILLDSLGVQSARLVGLSRGASVAASFATRWPERVDALVLYGTPPTPDFPLPPEMRGGPPFAAIARAHGMDSLRKWLDASPVAWYPPDRPQAADKIRKALADYDGRDLLDPRPASGRVPPATLADLSRLRVPVLLINGDHDMPMMRLIADTLARRIPGAKRVVIVNGGHGAHVAQPEAFNRELAAFLGSTRRQE